MEASPGGVARAVMTLLSPLPQGGRGRVSPPPRGGVRPKAGGGADRARPVRSTRRRPLHPFGVPLPQRGRRGVSLSPRGKESVSLSPLWGEYGRRPGGGSG